MPQSISTAAAAAAAAALLSALLISPLLFAHTSSFFESRATSPARPQPLGPRADRPTEANLICPVRRLEIERTDSSVHTVLYSTFTAQHSLVATLLFYLISSHLILSLVFAMCTGVLVFSRAPKTLRFSFHSLPHAVQYIHTHLTILYAVYVRAYLVCIYRC